MPMQFPRTLQRIGYQRTGDQRSARWYGSTLPSLLNDDEGMQLPSSIQRYRLVPLRRSLDHVPRNLPPKLLPDLAVEPIVQPTIHP